MKFFWRVLCLLALLAGLLSPQNGQAQTPENPLYIPFIAANEQDTSPLTTGMQVNVPFFPTNIPTARMGIFWFGQVTTETNYTDVRIGYNPTELLIYTNTFDKRIWYNRSENGTTLESWDAITLTLDLNGTATAQQPTTQSYRFVLQLNNVTPQPARNYQATYRGTGSGWTRQAVAFTGTVAPAANPAINDNTDDRGWAASFRIPFSSLGLTAQPANAAYWKFSLFLHDRDSSSGPVLPVVSWPQGSSVNSPASWGQIRFNLPSYVPAPSTSPVTVTVREGLNGVPVPDSMVGGGLNCGDTLNYWSAWGNQNYGNFADINVQNQMNLGDWPCYTKYYLSFPLNAVPAGKVIRSARLVMSHFGGSGEGSGATIPPSWIQVIAVSGSWGETTINWNNAPVFRENVSRTQVPVLPAGSTPVNREWDVSRAVAQAYQEGQSLNIALYSADGPLHTGKYFRGSEFRDAVNRPTLIIEYGNP